MMRLNIKYIIITLITFLYFSSKTHAQIDYEKVKSALILQLIEHVNWPNEDEINTFHIGYLGNDTVSYQILNLHFLKHTLKGKKVTIFKTEGSNLLKEKMQILIITKSHSKNLEKIYSSIEKRTFL